MEWSQNAASASSRKERNGIASLATKYTRLFAVSSQFRGGIWEVVGYPELYISPEIREVGPETLYYSTEVVMLTAGKTLVPTYLGLSRF